MKSTANLETGQAAATNLHKLGQHLQRMLD